MDVAPSDLAAAEEVLGRLVSIPSVNPRDGDAPAEAAVGEFVAGWLDAAGLRVTRHEVLPGRPNVIAVLPGVDRGRSLLLETHLDTVEPDGMTVEPFEPAARDGRLFGRGSCDAKGCLAAFMLALARVARGGESGRPAVNVVLAAVMDEEYLHRGVDHLVREQPHFDAAVVGEPTLLRPVIAHKGGLRFFVRTTGRGAHSSQPWNGDNAIERMTDVLACIRDTLQPALAMRRHPLVGPATLTVTLIEGGSGINVVPASCTIALDRRTLPGEDHDAVWSEYRRQLEEVAPGHVEVLEPDIVALGLESDPGSAVCSALGAALEGAGLDPRPVGVNYGSDAAVLAAARIPSVVFGPGSIDDAHQPDESVELAQVTTAAAVIENLVARFGR